MFSLPHNVWYSILTLSDNRTFATLSLVCRAFAEMSGNLDLISERCRKLSLPHGTYLNLSSKQKEKWFNGQLSGHSKTYSNGIQKSVHWYRDLKHGLEEWRYNDGKRWFCSWNYGQRHGLEYTLSPQNEVLFISKWEADKRTGMMCDWDPDTLQMQSYSEWSNDQKHGLEQVSEGDSVVMQSIWRFGKTVGDSYLFWISGQLRDVAFYNEEGLLEGQRLVYYDGPDDIPQQIQRRVNYSNGENHGTDEHFFMDGRLRSSRVYKHGVLDGMCRLWDPDGHLLEEACYSEGQPVGVHHCWHEKGGHLSQVVPYHKGLRHGTCRRFYKQGTVAHVSYWNMGLREGIEMQNFPDGGTWHFTTWRSGIKHGVEQEWIGGICTMLAQWENGYLQGKVKRYFASTGKLSSTKWHKGKLVGKAKEWYESGAIRSIRRYRNGKKHGYAEHFYENGNLSKKTLWSNGEKTGLQKFYYFDGQLEKTSRWSCGEKQGYELAWDPVGQLELMLPVVDNLLHGLGWSNDEGLLYFWEDDRVERASFVKLLNNEFVENPHTGEILIQLSESKKQLPKEPILLVNDGIQRFYAAIQPRVPIIVDEL